MAARADPWSGAVLAGGRSSRMGRDKALLPVGGVPMASIAKGALEVAGAAEVLSVGGDVAALGALGFRAVPDEHPGEGPLAGILTALGNAVTDVVVVLACDLPWAAPSAVATVLAALGDADAAVPVVDGRWEPLHAAYRRAVLPALRRAFEGGERAPRQALAAVRVADVRGLRRHWVASANTPADLP